MELQTRNFRQSGNVPEGGFRGILSGCFWRFGGKVLEQLVISAAGGAGTGSN
jgi:hypothetical protein